MATGKNPDGKAGAAKNPPGTNADKSESPDWAGGLRQLYDSVVDEPLPDSFKDLLSKLDDSESSDGTGNT